MNLFFPIETTNRELDYRLLLAAKIMRPGRKVVLAEYGYLQKCLKLFEGGVYVGKHLLPRLRPTETWERYQAVKSREIRLVYLHEEGAVFKGRETDWERMLALQYDAARFAGEDFLCVWGEWQKRFYDRQELAAQLRVTGHPRFDLCKEAYRSYYADEVSQLQKRYGDYILVNGNYGLVNNGAGLDFVFNPNRGYDPADVERRKAFIGFFTHSGKSMMDMIDLVHHLSAAFPERTIVYRSHPSEGDALYQQVFKGLKNVAVVHQGPVAPWVLGATSILHDGCTTAIEASFCDAVVINYRRVEDERYDVRLPNLVGVRAFEPEDAVALIQASEAKAWEGASRDEVGAMIDNVHHDGFDRLASVIEEAIEGCESGPRCSAPDGGTLQKVYRKRRFRDWRKSLGRGIGKGRADYHTKKFPGFQISEIQKKVARASAVVGRPMKLSHEDPYLCVLESGE